MLIHAFVSAIWTNPEPTILAIFDGLDKEFANLVRGGLLIALLGQND